MQPVLQFGDFRFDVEARLLMRGSRCLELAPKALDVLAGLVNHAGRVVSKDELLNLVWRNGVVEEGNLAVHISAIRRALGEDASTAEHIETIPKRGYRFAAPVTRCAPRAAAEQPQDLLRVAGHYLQQQTSEGCHRAAAAYRECIAGEPDNVRARAGLANAILFRFVLGDLGSDEAVPRVQALLREATEIDPLSADVHLTRSRLFCLFDWQWERAAEELDRALESADHGEVQWVARAWRGFDQAARGDLQRGLAELRRSSDACPLSTYIWRMRAGAHFMARDWEGCAAVCRKGLELHPGCSLLYIASGRALTALGEYDQARRYFRRAGLPGSGPQIALQAEIAYLDAIAGDRRSAAALLARLEHRAQTRHVSRVLIAEIYAALGNRGRALDYVEEACLTREGAIAGLRQNSRLDAIRNTSRYRSVLAQVGI